MQHVVIHRTGGPAILIVPRRSDLAALPEVVLPRFVRARFRWF